MTGGDRAAARAEPARLTSPVLVGRQHELDVLLHVLERPPAVAVVEGEAGVGKTRLVREALADPLLRGRPSLVGGCHPLAEPLPFGPVVEALDGAREFPLRQLGPIAGALRPLVPELSDRLPPALEPLGDPRGERHRVLRAIIEVLRALGPSVCVLEDLHWGDPETVELLRFLVSQLPDEVALVLTYRREDLPESSGVRALATRLPPEVAHGHLVLSAFDPGDVKTLVRSILEVEEVSDEFVRYLHERTLGLPLAVEEVLRLLADRRDLVKRDGRWARKVLDELEVPDAIRDSILERLAGLSAGARRVARAAAVAGVRSPEELLQGVAGLSPARTAQGLSEALTVGLLRELDEGRFGFRHALAAQAVYEAIPSPERRLLHLRAAHELERTPGSPPLAQLAYHFQRANQPRKWLRYAEAAADLALSLGNGSRACALLADALETPETTSAARARMAVKLGRAALSVLDRRPAVACLQRVLDEGGLPPGVRGEVRLYLGVLLDNQAEEVSTSRREIVRALPELRRRPALAAQAMSVLAVPMTREGDLAEHLAWMKRAVQAARRSDEPVVRTGVLANRATLLMDVGDPEAWRAVHDLPAEARSAGERRQLIRASSNLAHACLFLGHYGHAESFLSRARELSAEASDPLLASAADSTALRLDWATGRWDGLDARARRLAEANEDVARVFAEAQLVLGQLLLARGELLAARTHLRAARDAAVTGGALMVEIPVAAALARMQLARGDARGAAETVGAGLDIVRRKGIWVWAAEVAPVLTDALVTSGRRPEAAGLVAELAKRLRGRDAPAASAALAICRAVVAASEGRTKQAAAAAFARAERRLLELPRPYDAARCLEERALLGLSRHPERGKELLLGALEQFDALGATWDAKRVRRSLRTLGVARPWRGGRRGYGTRLSPRELEVARLAAAGRTNREIAEALVLSPRTVEDHVAKAMRKLRVQSRAALATVEDEMKVP